MHFQVTAALFLYILMEYMVVTSSKKFLYLTAITIVFFTTRANHVSSIVVFISSRNYPTTKIQFSFTLCTHIYIFY